MHNFSGGEERQEFEMGGVTRREFWRRAAMLSAGVALPFYNEAALAQDVKGLASIPPDTLRLNANENPRRSVPGRPGGDPGGRRAGESVSIPNDRGVHPDGSRRRGVARLPHPASRRVQRSTPPVCPRVYVPNPAAGHCHPRVTRPRRGPPVSSGRKWSRSRFVRTTLTTRMRWPGRTRTPGWA
jgi:hypothetical protein